MDKGLKGTVKYEHFLGGKTILFLKHHLKWLYNIPFVNGAMI